MRVFAAAITLGLSIAVAGSLPALADQSDKANFTLSLRGITAGNLTVNGAITGGSYTAEGVFQSAGIVGGCPQTALRCAGEGQLQVRKIHPVGLLGKGRYAQAQIGSDDGL